MRTNALVDHGGIPLRAAIYMSCSSWRTHTVWYRVNWRLFTTVWIYSHPTACCFFLVLLPVLQTIHKCAFWVIFLEDSLAASRWTNWCLLSGCVLIRDALDKAPANQLDWDPLGPSWGGCGRLIRWCGRGEEDDNEKKWGILRII